METEFEELLGKTITEIKTGRWKNVGEKYKTPRYKFVSENPTEEVQFKCSDGSEYRMYHEQDCCEYVYLEDVTGNLQDLIGNPITLAEEVSFNDEHPEGTYSLL